MSDPWEHVKAPEPPTPEPTPPSPPTTPAPTAPAHPAGADTPAESTVIVHGGGGGAEARIRRSLHEAHLARPDAHADAVKALHEIATGKVKREVMDKEGGVHRLATNPNTMVSAAKALLQHGSQLVPATIHVGHANIIHAGDLIANVDPERLRAAVDKAKGQTT